MNWLQGGQGKSEKNHFLKKIYFFNFRERGVGGAEKEGDKQTPC